MHVTSLPVSVTPGEHLQAAQTVGLALQPPLVHRVLLGDGWQRATRGLDLHETPGHLPGGAPEDPPPEGVAPNVLQPEAGTTKMAADKAAIPTLVNAFATFLQMLRMIRSSISYPATHPFAL